jgi:hypothetical protein
MSDRQTPFRGRGAFLAALASVPALGFQRGSKEWNEVKGCGDRHGKHNGAIPGAFGGPGRAKRHRSVYVREHGI